MLKEQVLSKIKEIGIVAVVRANTKEHAMEIVEKCVEGGVNAIELTFTTPEAHTVISELNKKYGDKIILGAGTVLDSETARMAILSGAEFIVSPHFDENIVKLCNRYQKAVMCGIMTITEAVHAMEAGCDILKVFPGDVLGSKFIKAIKGPLPYAQLMPTGGVDINNVADWINVGAVAVGAGSCLTKGDITKNAKEFVKEIKTAREMRSL